jgi:hypothetical protein
MDNRHKDTKKNENKDWVRMFLNRVLKKHFQYPVKHLLCFALFGALGELGGSMGFGCRF